MNLLKSKPNGNHTQKIKNCTKKEQLKKVEIEKKAWKPLDKNNRQKHKGK